MLPRSLWLLISLVGSTLVVVGCESTVAHVSGNVTIDGLPLEKGVIVFTAADGESKGQSARADILSGKYEVKVTAGKQKVQISAPFLVTKDGYELTRERLPSHFNSATNLEYDVTAGVQTIVQPLFFSSGLGLVGG